MPLPKHQEWHIAYDLHPTYNFSTPPVKKMKIRPCGHIWITSSPMSAHIWTPTSSPMSAHIWTPLFDACLWITELSDNTWKLKLLKKTWWKILPKSVDSDKSCRVFRIIITDDIHARKRDKCKIPLTVLLLSQCLGSFQMSHFRRMRRLTHCLLLQWHSTHRKCDV